MVQLARKYGDHRMTKDLKNVEQTPRPDSFFEKVEKATPAQVSQAIIAKILLKLKKDKKD